MNVANGLSEYNYNDAERCWLTLALSLYMEFKYLIIYQFGSIRF